MSASSTNSSHDVLLFDLYGTLFNISRINEACRRVTDHPDDLSRLWRARQVEFALIHTLIGQFIDFDELTANALSRALDETRLRADDGQRRALVDIWRHLPLYPDVLPCLQELHQAGVPLAVLSNGTAASINALLDDAGLSGIFERVFSSDQARVYKPSPQIYELAIDHYKTDPSRLLLVSSNGFDIAGAHARGLSVCRVNRLNLPMEPFGFEPELTVSGFAAIPSAVLSGV